MEKELETYHRELPGFIQQAGKFVVIRGSDVLGFWDTYEDAMQDGYCECGLTKRFLVKKIEVVETIHFNSRSVQPRCRR